MLPLRFGLHLSPADCVLIACIHVDVFIFTIVTRVFRLSLSSFVFDCTLYYVLFKRRMQATNQS